jgi:hypothetical protein
MANQNVSIDDNETSAVETDAGSTLSAAERAELVARCREHQAYWDRTYQRLLRDTQASPPRGTSLNWWQVVIVRSSRHVTYF